MRNPDPTKVDQGNHSRDDLINKTRGDLEKDKPVFDSHTHSYNSHDGGGPHAKR